MRAGKESSIAARSVGMRRPIRRAEWIRGVRAQLEGIQEAKRRSWWDAWDSHAAALGFVFESRVRCPRVLTPSPPP